MSEAELGIIKKRRPLIAVVLSFIMPGMGHLYCGKITKAIALAFICCVFIPLCFYIPFLSYQSIRTTVMVAPLFASLAVWLIAIIDSCLVAKRTSESYTLKDYNRWYIYLILILTSIASSLLAKLYIREKLVEAFKVPSTSSYPTIVPGDGLLANKLAYQKDDPKRGDTVVLISPKDIKIKYVKRVVAVAGDTVEIKNNELYINDQKLPRRQLSASDLDKIRIEVYGQLLNGDLYEETNGDAKYKIFLAKPPHDLAPPDFAKITVPENHCFTLGDNRSISRDSRDFGPIPLATIIGRADYIYWPAKDWSRFGSLKNK